MCVNHASASGRHHAKHHAKHARGASHNASNNNGSSTSSSGTISPSFEVAFVSNLLERLYKDPNHTITLAENQSALNSDKAVADLSQQAINSGQLSTTQQSAATSTQKLYAKKTNFDLMFANLFGKDANGVTISDVRKMFGQTVDKQILGGLTLPQVIYLHDSLGSTGNLQKQKELDFWVHGQGSHEGDLVMSNGQRVGAVSLLQNVNPYTDQAVETTDQAKARSELATSQAPAVNPLAPLPSRSAFQAELQKEDKGQIDQVFVNSEITGHKAKGDFIQDVLVNRMGDTALQSAADANHTISANASAFNLDYANVGYNQTFINRQTGAAYFGRQV